MKIIFWNIGYVPGLNGSFFHYITKGHRLVWSTVKTQKKLLDDIAVQIDAEAPDLFLYSEVSMGAWRNRYLHQHEYLVGQIASVRTHGAAGKYRRSLFYSLPLHAGNANGFLSSHECFSDTMHLNSGSKTLAYIVVVQGVTVIMVHLSLSKRLRAKQFAELVEIAAEIKGPLVVCGDMNIFNGVVELEPLTNKTGIIVPAEVPKTFPAHRPKYSLDIFLTRGIEGEVRVRTIENTISDHLPIVLEFKK